MSEEQNQRTPLGTVRHENFESLYANNVQFYSTEWDLKMMFGELDPRGNEVVVEQHTAIAIPWLQAKLLIYYLLVNVGIYELGHGRIKIPKSLIPPHPPSLTDEEKDDPMFEKVRDFVEKIRAEYLATADLSS